MSSGRHRSQSQSRDRSDSPEPRLPGGAEPISESDYFRKNNEFRSWLKDEKRKVRAYGQRDQLPDLIHASHSTLTNCLGTKQGSRYLTPLALLLLSTTQILPQVC